MKNKYLKFTLFFIGTLIAAINFNLILLPNNIVIGGVSGIAILFHHLLGLHPSLTISLISGVYALHILAVKKEKNIVKVLLSTYLFPILIYLTGFMLKNTELPIKDNIILVIISIILTTISSIFVIKNDYEIDGSNMSTRLLTEKNISYKDAASVQNVIIVMFSGIFFGFRKSIYGLVILLIKNYLVERSLLGVSDSKLFFIYTKNIKELKQMIIKEMKTGVTILNVEGGFSNKKTKMIMCVVNTRDYYVFKKKILEIDKNAFIMINDCYETKGGIKKNKLPFN